MSYIKTKGIVLKETLTGDADKIITIFSKDYGKITSYVKGVRKPKSRFIAGCQYLCYSDFILYEGAKIHNLSSCEVIEPFYELRNDLVKLTYSAHMSEIINDVIQENQQSNKLLQLFLNTLYILTKTQRDPKLLTRIFELRLLTISGYCPHIRSCLNCKSTLSEEWFFNINQGGFVCEVCKNLNISTYAISNGALKAISYIVCSTTKELFKFELSGAVLDELDSIIPKYLKSRLEKDYKKLEFLNSL